MSYTINTCFQQLLHKNTSLISYAVKKNWCLHETFSDTNVLCRPLFVLGLLTGSYSMIIPDEIGSRSRLTAVAL